MVASLTTWFATPHYGGVGEGLVIATDFEKLVYSMLLFSFLELT